MPHVLGLVGWGITDMLNETTENPTPLPGRNDEQARLDNAIVAMRRNPALPHTVSTLARLSGMSRSNFAEAFRGEFGRSPMELLRGLRMDLAATLLRDDDMSIKLVGASVGYTSRASFSHAFQRCFGVSPAEFRESQILYSPNDIHAVSERLRQHSGPSQQLAWEVDLASGKVWWSEGTFTALGFDASARLISDVARFYERVHPDDRGRIVQEVQAASQNNELAWQSSFRFRRADGEFARIRNACLILRDEGGAPLRLVGAMQIDER